MGDASAPTYPRALRPDDPLADRRLAEDSALDSRAINEFQPLKPYAASVHEPIAGSRKRTWPGVLWTGIVLLCLVALVGFLIIGAGISLVTQLDTAFPGSGRIFAVVLILSLILLASSMVASLVSYFRLRALLRLPPVDVLDLRRDALGDLQALRSLRERLEARLDRVDVGLSESQVARLEATRADMRVRPHDNTRQWLLAYDETVLSIIDEAVADHIQREAVNIAALTMVSTRHGLDSLLVLWRQVRLVRHIALAYGWRPDAVGTLALLRRVVMNASLAAGLEELGDLLVEAVPAHKVAAYAGGFLTEAVGNAAFTLRTARYCVDACRPIKNRAAAPYRVGLIDVARRLPGVVWRRDKPPAAVDPAAMKEGAS
ncbi:MAG: DUF697 domain-containing protein [Candidatus Binatia bacterium]